MPKIRITHFTSKYSQKNAEWYLIFSFFTLCNNQSPDRIGSVQHNTSCSMSFTALRFQFRRSEIGFIKVLGFACTYIYLHWATESMSCAHVRADTLLGKISSKQVFDNYVSKNRPRECPLCSKKWKNTIMANELRLYELNLISNIIFHKN